ncbi:RNB domain-containing ribonuclease [bacterium]|nr:RNB domain-containing ribonuclease [bacterium]
MRKTKLVIVPVQGKEFNSSSNRLEYIWQGTVFQKEKEALAYLAQQAERVLAESNRIDLDVIHELCDIDTPYTLEDLADNFLDDPDDGWARVALLINIKRDRTRFQQKKNQFFARSLEEIQKLEEESEKKLENERRQLKEKEWADKLRNNELPEIVSAEEDHWQHFLHRIQNFLLHLENSQEKDYFYALFQCQGTEPIITERRLLDVLSLAGIKISWGNLILSRVSAHAKISDAELAAVAEMKGLDIWKGNYQLETRDQRAITTYTVDNAETRDYDDAVSWEKQNGGGILRVHIADVASYIVKNSLLFQHSENRLSSLYTVKKVCPMFHPDLSEDLFSLRQSCDRPVLTFEAQIDENGAMGTTQIYRSVINVSENLSYEAVDKAIVQGVPFWNDMWQSCQRLKDKRIENGSLELERVEIKLDISDPDNIEIKEVRENTPANMMIQELAIFANHQAASFCKQHNLLCLYRNQPPYSINKELAEDEKPTLRDIHIQPARIATNPEGHSALGLDCYQQVTSPIRRFLDLVNQGVIFSRLADVESGYTSDEMLSWARQGEEIQREYSAIERRLLDHWKIKYLEQHRDDIFDAEMIRTLRNGKSLIKIQKIQLIVDCMLDEVPHQPFQVVVDQVTPKYDRVIVRPYFDGTTKLTSEVEEHYPET